ncbi:MAG: GTP-binding protein, partial [Selenomonadaceae bacterium]|nr:GTP-binding protein [Selenomonadaceae bacterium]
MKEYKSTNIHNVAVIGHGKTGKTSLLEACLFNAGAVKRLGKVDDGTGVLDYEQEETKRKMTINDTLAVSEWKGYKLNFIDTPGYPDFVGEVRGALAAADSALIVISAPAGIEVETEKVWGLCEEMDLPRAFFVNKMDREHADFHHVVEELRVKFGDGVVPVQVPIGKEAAFQGVADLLSLRMKIVRHEEDEIPEYVKGEVEESRQKLIEAVAEFNNELLEKYIEGADITEVEVAAAMIEGIQAGKIFPVFCGSALQNAGIKKLMDGIVEYMPTPYFKVSIGVHPQTD